MPKRPPIPFRKIRAIRLLAQISQQLIPGHGSNVTNSGVVPNPLGCRTLYVNGTGRSWGFEAPLFDSTSRCVISGVTYLQETSSHTLSHNKTTRIGEMRLYYWFLMSQSYLSNIFYNTMDPLEPRY